MLRRDARQMHADLVKVELPRSEHRRPRLENGAPNHSDLMSDLVCNEDGLQDAVPGDQPDDGMPRLVNAD